MTQNKKIDAGLIFLFIFFSPIFLILTILSMIYWITWWVFNHGTPWMQRQAKEIEWIDQVWREG